jgi:DNA-binding CsgD family transcriptional regulator/tetratricopeptide (TPR) repeat protein
LLLEAATHPPAVAVVEGEAGVGKTRLVQEFLACPELGKRHRYVGGCQPLSEPFPFGPLVEALREASPVVAALTPVVGALRPLLPELSGILPPLPESLGERRAERHRQFRALRELLDALGRAVLVLEDLHWADEATVELLRFLVPQLPPGLTLVCTYRGEDLAETSPLLGLVARLPNEIASAQLSLRPLGKKQVRELAEAILDEGKISDEFAGYLFAGSGGLPFAVEELLRLLNNRKDLTRHRGVWVRRSLEELGVPKRLQDSIIERLNGLSKDARAVVKAAAVLAVATDEEILLEVADLPDARAGHALAEALSSALLREPEDGVYSVRHVLARQAVEEAISSPLLRRLHLGAAQALEPLRPKPLARLAHHYRAAGKTKEWIRYAEAVSDRARSLEDDATAFRFLKEAVAVRGLPAATRGRLAVKLATHAQYCLAHGEAIEMLRRVLDNGTLSRGTRGELRLWLARLLIGEGELESAHSETERALEDLSRRPALAAQAMMQLACLPWFTEGPIETQLSLLDRALETAARSTDRATRIAVAAGRAMSLLCVGDPAGWQAVEEIPPPEPVEDEIRQAMRAHGNVADALLHLGHYERAEEHLCEGLRLRSQLAHSIEICAHRITELQLRWVCGCWDDLDERARFFMEAWDGWAAMRADAQAVLGLLLLARGEVRASLRLLDPLAGDFRGEAPVRGWVVGALARVQLAQGRSEAAVEEGVRGLEPIRQSGIWVWATEVAPVTVEALLATGGRAEAQELARRFAAGLRGRDAPAAAAALALCRALLAEAEREPQRAARAYLAAERAWASLPRPYEAARAREGAGRCLLAGGVDGGRELLVEAMDAFRGLEARWDAARVRRTFREHGLTAPVAQRGRKSYPDELSPRQAEVARLAACGLTNREIALELFLSPKTVENYLGAAMRKLEVTSRTELLGQLEQPSPRGAREDASNK